MASSVSEVLRLTNDRVRQLMCRMQSGEGNEALVEREDFENLLQEVTRAAAWLRQVPPRSIPDPEWSKEACNYRNTLQQLQHILPAIEKRLLAEKMRMEITHTHLAAAMGWANASKSTV